LPFDSPLTERATTLVSFPPAKIVTTVDSSGTNGSSRCRKLKSTRGPYDCEICWMRGLSTAPGMPRLRSVAGPPLAASCRAITCT
jgi:hypothetical protein